MGHPKVKGINGVQIMKSMCSTHANLRSIREQAEITARQASILYSMADQAITELENEYKVRPCKKSRGGKGSKKKRAG